MDDLIDAVKELTATVKESRRDTRTSGPTKVQPPEESTLKSVPTIQSRHGRLTPELAGGLAKLLGGKE